MMSCTDKPAMQCSSDVVQMTKQQANVNLQWLQRHLQGGKPQQHTCIFDLIIRQEQALDKDCLVTLSTEL